MCTSGERRRPKSGSSNQGLHTFNLACAHRSNEVGQQHAVLAKVCTHHSSVNLHTSINLPTSNVACLHHLLLALVKRATSHAVTLVKV
ncbi:hypothetical protein H5410_014721 [Solanum commersonii]|uniref:Uncharacterized protein n=1 Tax=Solanum commersonii TaxID=4109 RepID=A0A9J5ZRR2_SOLCO|nr:hypothetical protein H5410_014721 [Solanum commersonii]